MAKALRPEIEDAFAIEAWRSDPVANQMKALFVEACRKQQQVEVVQRGLEMVIHELILMLAARLDYYGQPHRRGPKRKGRFIQCRTCGGPRYVRPSFLAKGARFCSPRCVAKDPEWRQAVGSYGGRRHAG